jgi:hypothetical protein
MTSQEKEANKELIDEAQELGIYNPKVLSLENLKLKVAEAKAPEPEAEPEVTVQKEEKRSKAPRMNVSNINEDTRERVVAEMRVKEPENEFLFMKGDVTDVELQAKGLQRTGVSVKNDILCRTNKESFKEWMDAKGDAALNSMRKIEKDDGGTGRIVRQLTEVAQKTTLI